MIAKLRFAPHHARLPDHDGLGNLREWNGLPVRRGDIDSRDIRNGIAVLLGRAHHDIDQLVAFTELPTVVPLKFMPVASAIDWLVTPRARALS